MSHWGTNPSTIAAAIVAAMAPIKMVAGAKCVRSVARIEDESPESIEGGLVDGVPGILVCFKGGTMEAADTQAARWQDKLNFRLLCCVGAKRDGDERFSGGETTPSTAINPGIEDLQDWALYYALRACRALGGVRIVHPVAHTQATRVPDKPLLLVAAVDFIASRWVDVYDDPSGDIFERLGLVKNPSDPLVPAPGHLFEVDNVTPKSDDANPGGVYTPTP